MNAKSLYRNHDWYLAGSEEEEDFVGMLRRLPERGPYIGRSSLYLLEIGKERLPIYTGAKPVENLEILIDRKVRIKGKKKILQIDKTRREIWPATIEEVLS